MTEPHVTALGDVPVRIHAAGGGSRGAALLFFHGLRSSADVLDTDARTIAASGITVVLADAPHHGARHDEVLRSMPDTGTRAGYATLLRILREARDEIPGLVDELFARGFTRVALGGVSLGGYIALAGGVVERRLAAIVSVLGSPDWTPHEGEAASPASLETYAEALSESPHLRAEALAPRPLLLLNASRDANVLPEPARALAAKLRPAYERAGRGDLLVHRELDAEHYVPEPMWREDVIPTTASFLARVLGGDVTGTT